MLAGGELGVDARGAAVHLEVLASIFLRLINVAVAPLIFGTLTTGIAAHANLRKLGRVALKTLLYFEAITTLGLLIGMVAINLSQAGKGRSFLYHRRSDSGYSRAPWRRDSYPEYFPGESGAGSRAKPDFADCRFFAVVRHGDGALACAKTRSAARRARVFYRGDLSVHPDHHVSRSGGRRSSHGLLGWNHWPGHAHGAGETGGDLLMPRLPFWLSASCCPFCSLARIPARAFLRAISEPAAIAFATSTSEAALPVALDSMERFGVPRWIVSFVIPTGYSFNMDGTSVYLAIGAIFAAQASGIHLSLAQQAIVLFTLMLTSKGVAGVPRAVLVDSAGDTSQPAHPHSPHPAHARRRCPDGHGTHRDECYRQLPGLGRHRPMGRRVGGSSRIRPERTRLEPF